MMSEKVTFRIKRFNPDEAERGSYWEEFDIEVVKGKTLLEGFFDIMETMDGSLTFRFACRAGICGSDAVYVNGKYVLACQEQVSFYKGTVNIEPLPFYPIIKDLVIDMEPFFSKIRAINPFIILKKSLEEEVIQSSEEKERMGNSIDCILCGSCYSSCVTVWTDPEYLGPAALLKAYRYVRDSRDAMTDERIGLINGNHGVWRCHTAFNCGEACPKDLNPTEAIAYLKRQAVKKRFSRLFGK